MAEESDQDTVWNTSNEQQLFNFSTNKPNLRTLFSYSHARRTFDRNKGKGQIASSRMSQRDSISSLLFTGYYREVYPELKIKLFIGNDVISLCTRYCFGASLFMIGVGQSGINITLDLIKQRYRDYYQNEDDISQTGYPDPYLSQKAVPPRPNCMFVDSTRYIPRKANATLESDEILTSQNSIITSKRAVSSNFANSYYGDGAELMSDYMSKLRKKLERRDQIGCIQFIHSLGGGTGSGLGTGLLERVKDDYPYLQSMSFPIFQCHSHPHSSSWNRSVLNTVLGIDKLQKFSDIVFPIYNSCLQRISEDINWEWTKDDTDFKIVSHNRICNDVIGDLSVLLNQFLSVEMFEQEMIEYPSLKWLTCSKYPYSLYNENNNIERNRSLYGNVADFDYLMNVFDHRQDLITENHSKGRNLSTILLYQGFEENNHKPLMVNNKEIAPSVLLDKEIITFNAKEKRLGSKSVTMFANCTRFKDNLDDVLEDYKFILQQPDKGIINEFKDVGMSEEDFMEARESVENLISDYNQHRLSSADKLDLTLQNTTLLMQKIMMLPIFRNLNVQNGNPVTTTQQ